MASGRYTTKYFEKVEYCFLLLQPTIFKNVNNETRKDEIKFQK